MFSVAILLEKYNCIIVSSTLEAIIYTLGLLIFVNYPTINLYLRIYLENHPKGVNYYS